MRYLLTDGGRAVLRHFARRGTLLAFDYDGTLAPIVADRAQAHMRESTRKLLAQVVRRYPSIVLTGRARLDALRFLGGIESLEVIGNHGLESEGACVARFARLVQSWRAALEPALRAIPGLAIEDKRYSLALHYRACADKDAARAAAWRAAEGLDGVRPIGGHDVLNLVPAQATHKGAALLAACARFDCPRAIFIGDDDTDEDVFALHQPDRILTIRVGERADSAAQYHLRDQSEMDALLQLLLEFARA